ncbi:MAG: glutamine--fructose-6-phosphate transaminase (isomerizing) [Nitrospirae bacterium]|nr:glutamine--fructose-6-phosphate transaminase (isomerizing) [Nitrospirota bacterium]
MCGIIGYTGKRDAVTVILDGLSRLEYRGYDSAGIAYFRDSEIEVKRCKGKIKDLKGIFGLNLPSSQTAIGHTRWATHGKPSEENAHPHRSDGVVLVHNGIIENFLSIRKLLEKEGFIFTSETDTEVICHLIRKYHTKGLPLEDAIREAVKVLRGAYAIAVMSSKEPGKVVGVKKDSPLVVGIGEGESFVASDVPAFLNYSKDVVFLNDKEMVVMTDKEVRFMDINGSTLAKEVKKILWDSSMAEKGGYKHFMLKEIYEQPRAIADTIIGRFNADTGQINLEEFGIDESTLNAINRVCIVACGTSWHAGLLGKYIIEAISRVQVQVDIASEFRYRNPVIDGSGVLFVTISQSGETADSLAAQREAKRLGAKVMSICNVMGSTSSRDADYVFYTRSGPEIGVASTKSFVTQIVGIYLFAIALGMAKGTVSEEGSKELLAELLSIPDKVETILLKGTEIEKIAKEFFKKKDFLYLGRGTLYPIALEGALKLKEISYIHAEAYPSGEMKHGPIALIDEELPVLFLAPKDRLYEKVISNIHEVKTRGGNIVSVISEGDTEVRNLTEYSIEVPESNEFLMAVLFTVPLQLLAYYIGVLRGCDVDQPRNLAKSVTVE